MRTCSVWGRDKASKTNQHLLVCQTTLQQAMALFVVVLCIFWNMLNYVLIVLPVHLKYGTGVARMTTGGQNPTINDTWCRKDPDPSEDIVMGRPLFYKTLLCLSSNVVLPSCDYPQQQLLVVPSSQQDTFKWLRIWSGLRVKFATDSGFVKRKTESVANFLLAIF